MNKRQGLYVPSAWMDMMFPCRIHCLQEIPQGYAAGTLKEVRWAAVVVILSPAASSRPSETRHLKSVNVTHNCLATSASTHSSQSDLRHFFSHARAQLPLKWLPRDAEHLLRSNGATQWQQDNSRLLVSATQPDFWGCLPLWIHHPGL